MIQEASAMGLLRTLLIIGAIWFGFKILARLFAPLLVKFVAKKAEEKFREHTGNFTTQNRQYTNQNSKEGETVIDKMPQANKTSNKKVGEYIDYEEID